MTGCPGIVKFINTAKTGVEEQDSGNWLSFLHFVNCDWINRDLSKDALRVILISAFLNNLTNCFDGFLHIDHCSILFWHN